MRLILTLMIVTLLSIQTAFGETDNKRVVLQAETKDPIQVYNLALPAIWGPLAAHDYLSSSPIRWRENIPEVKSKATQYALLNVITIAGGIWLMATSYDEKEVQHGYYPYYYTTTEDEFKYFQYALGMALAFLGPGVENHFFGDYCAKWAVEYNKKLYKQFNYEPPPLSLNLQDKDIKLSWDTQF